MKKALVINARDNVATALYEIKQGEKVNVERNNAEIQIELKNDIGFGHKFSLEYIKTGQEILKYGEPIGVACQDITPGEHVHIQNMESQRGRGDKT